MKLLETMDKKIQFEVQVPTKDTSSSYRTITEAFDCHLTHDKVMMEIVPSQRDNYADLGFYVFNVAEGLQNIKTGTTRKEFKSRWSQR